MSEVNRTVGLVGLDTSHVSHFTRMLNRGDDPHHVPGARVVAAWPGGSEDFDLSRSRVEGFTRELREQYGVAMLDTPEAVAARCDVVMITAVDGRAHRALAERIVPAGKPVFIDKPLATTLADARAIVELAARHNVPLMSASSLRYADHLTAALREAKQVAGVDVYGPLALQETQPGFFWYGIHSVEIVVTVLGHAIREVRTMGTARHDAVLLRHEDGRVAMIHGLRGSHSQFGAVLHTPEGPRALDLSNNPRPYYASLLEAVIGGLGRGVSPVAVDEMLAVTAVIEAINRSRASGEAQAVER